MKARRFLATLLCAAMIFGDASLVSAAEPAVAVATESVEAVESNAIIADDASVIGTADGQEVVIEDEKETSEEKTSEEKTSDEDVTTVEITDVQSEIIEELPADKAELSEKADAIVVTDEEDEDTVEGITDFLTVDADGNLKKINPGVDVKISNIILPKTFNVGGEEVYLKRIPSNVFANDSNIRTLSFDDGSHLTTIDAGAFAGSSIEEIILPTPTTDNDTGITYEVTSISANTFKNSSLKKIQFNSCHIKTIGNAAFQSSKIINFVAPTSLETIGESAFSGCTDLQGADLNGVVNIGEDAFLDCTSLGSSGTIRNLRYIETIGNRAFKNCGFTDLDFSGAISLREVGTSIFEGCKSLTTVHTPDSLSAITQKMFKDCEKLKNVTIGSEYPLTTTIGVEAFEGCKALVEIDLPDSVYEIKTKAFNNCDKLVRVAILYWWEDVKIDKYAFPAVGTKLTLQGYSNTLEAFAIENGYKFVDISETEDIDVAGFKNSKVVISTRDKASNLKPRRFEKVYISITPNSGKTLFPDAAGRFITAKEYEGSKLVRTFSTEELPFTFISCENGVLKFSFDMPVLKKNKNKFKLSGVIDDITVNAADEKNLELHVADMSGVEKFVDGKPATLVFKETGSSTRLVFTDAKAREIGPWRFEYSVASESSDVVRVSAEGTVTARTNTQKTGVVNAKLKSSSLVYPINVTVKNAVIVEKMRFKFSDSRTDLPGTTLYEFEGYSQPSKMHWGVEEKTEIEVVNEGEDNEYTREVTRTYQYVEVPKSTVTAAQKKNAKVQIKVQAQANYVLDEYGYVAEYKTVDTNWTSGETTIAKPVLAKSTNGYNYIDIPYTAVGETVLTVSCDNPTAADVNQRIFTTGIIVRVVDDTPRLLSGIITVNAYDSMGTKLPLATVDNYPIDNNDLFLSANKTAGNTDNITDLEIHYYNGDYYLKASASLLNSMKGDEIKSFNKLYIKGEISAEPFVIPAGLIYVEKKKLVNTITTGGAINLFYKTTDGLDPKRVNSGRALVYQDLTYEKVSSYVLWSKENHENIKNNRALVFDELQNNFSIRLYDVNQGIGEITRTENELVMQKAAPTKPVVSGYLYTYYEGYSDPVVSAFTVPTKVSAPSYTLDFTSKVAHVSQKKQEYQLMLFDKSTKTLPVISEKNQYDEVVKHYNNVLEGGTVTLDQTDSTTRNLFDANSLKIVKVENVEFKDPNNSKEKISISVNKISVSLRGTPVNGKGVINVQCKNWESPVKYTLTIKATKNDAKAKLSVKTITLNTAADTVTGETKLTLDQDFAEYIGPMDGSDFTYKCKDALSGTAETIKRNLSVERISVNGVPNNGAIIKVSIPRNASVDNGSYTFEFYPKVKYTEDYSKTLKKLNFKVVVTDKEPKIKFKSGTFNLNGKYPGVEAVKTTFSLQNMPSGDYDVDFSQLELEPVSKPKNADDEDTMNKVKNYLVATYIPKVETDSVKEPAYISFGFKKGTPEFYTKCGYKYKANNIYVVKDGKRVSMAPVNITVNVKLLDPVASQSAKGSINPVDPVSNIVYTAKIKNINLKVVSANCVEYDDYGVEHTAESDKHFTVKLITQEDYEDDSTGYRANTNIKLKDKKVIDNQILVQWNDNQLENNKKYRIRLQYLLEDKDVGIVESKVITIAPKQKLSGVKSTVVKPEKSKSSNVPTSGLTPEQLAELQEQMKTEQANTTNSAVLYSYSKSNQQVITRVTPTSVKDAVISEVRMYMPANPTAEQKRLRRAFSFNFYKVLPDSYDYSSYYIFDVKNNYIKVTFDATTSISVNNISGSSFTGVKADDLESFAVELATKERLYRATFTDDTKYLKGDAHYYVKTDLLNPGLVKLDKVLPIVVEVRYKNQYKNTVGSKFPINITVKK